MSEKKTDAPSEGIIPRRECLDLDIGRFVESEGVVYKIVQHIDFESLLGKNVETGRSKPLLIANLSPPKSSGGGNFDLPVDLDVIEDKDWKVAAERYEAIKPLLSFGPLIGREEVAKIASRYFG